MVKYTRIFDPPLVETAGDDAGGSEYVYTDHAVLVINTALVTGRPVLIRGRSGTGKTSLARDVAEVLRWRFEKETITSTTQAEELKWRVDFVERLALAQGGKATAAQLELRNFVRPGPLWWGFDRTTARAHGEREMQRDTAEAVVLLDEIDKADPDLPNGLLEPLEDGEFRVAPADDLLVRRHHPGQGPQGETVRTPLVFATTNEERRLPDAFLRRCLELRVEYPSKQRMAAIARVHRLDGAFDAVWTALFGTADEMAISPAEFLDTARAYVDLGSDAGLLRVLQDITAWKHGRSRPGEARDDGVV